MVVLNHTFKRLSIPVNVYFQAHFKGSLDHILGTLRAFQRQKCHQLLSVCRHLTITDRTSGSTVFVPVGGESFNSIPVLFRILLSKSVMKCPPKPIVNPRRKTKG